jgi:hypothetical protein
MLVDRLGNGPHVTVCKAFVLMGFVLLLAALPAAGQITGASIQGTVTDETGAVMPGVTVTIGSEVLIVSQMLAVTDARGLYVFNELPVGVYSVRYELAGFQAMVQEDIQLTAGFTATINVDLQIGTVEEVITVTGASPVVDVSHTTPRTAITNQQLLDEIPTARNYKEIIQQIPSIVGRKQDLFAGVAATGLGAYGIGGQQTTMIDGVNTRQTSGSVGVSPDFSSLAEFNVVASGGTAEQGLPGLFVNLITKSGGNVFHGRTEISGTNDTLVGDNIQGLPAKAQGLRRETLDHSYEFLADIGGPIVTDKAWFYGGLRWSPLKRSPFELSGGRGPDGIYDTLDDEPGLQKNKIHNLTTKLTFQVTPQYKFIAFAHFNAYDEKPHTWSSVKRGYPREQGRDLHASPTHVKGEIQGTPSSNVFFSAKLGTMQHNGGYFQSSEADTALRVHDLDRQIRLDWTYSLAQFRRMQWQPDVSLTWIPTRSFGGRHEFKVGWGYMHRFEGRGERNMCCRPNSNYVLVTDNINGVPNAPYQLRTYNYPTEPKNYIAESGTYVQDIWRMGDRVTAQLGFRFDTFRTWVPDSEKACGQFGACGPIKGFPTGDWSPIAPRLGLAYDLTGEGKTVLKASWGKYNSTPGDNYSVTYNPHNTVVTTYFWDDPNGSGDWEPGEIDLDINGPNFARIQGGSNASVNPDLNMPSTYETTFGVEHELARSFAARITYVHVKQLDLFGNVNIGRPMSAWNMPYTVRDPGQDRVVGTADDGGMFTLFDFAPSFRGADFVNVTRINRDDAYAPSAHTIEAVLQRRTSNNWGLMTSFSATRFQGFRVGYPTSPNDEINNKFGYWTQQLKISGTYNFPADVQLAGGLFVYSGHVGGNTNRFTGFPQTGNINLRVEPFGSTTGPIQSLLNFRLSKNIFFANGKRWRLGLDMLNLMNNASQWSISRAYGPTYGRINSIDQPRTIQFRTSWDF